MMPEIFYLQLISFLGGHFETRKWLPMLIASISAIPI
jgi:hypothetical protein